jgi:hypothetical protein
MRSDRDWLQFDCALSYVDFWNTSAHAGGASRLIGWSPRQRIPHGGHQMSFNIAAG